MQKTVILVLIVTGIISCGNPSSEDKFSVNGTIANNNAKMIYLEEVPATTMQPILVDSAIIGKDGKFILHTNKKESMLYGLRLDKNRYPVVYVINDAEKIDLNITLSKENNQFADKYEISGSTASQSMKDFVSAFNDDLQQLYYTVIRIDSLKEEEAADSVLVPILSEHEALTNKIKNYSENAFARANNPALLIFELGYYESIAKGAGYGLQPIDDEKISEIINKATMQYPSHKGLESVKKTLTEEAEKNMVTSLVGKQAPDFSLPDVNGNEVKLSSFRGKYVLVDFWASWCGPCRAENPHVVKAYNQFKNKNFTILGVSLDREGQKDRWLKAIKDDGLAWTHVSDLKYWESSVVPLYHIQGIPYNVLLDKEGNVIAEGLRGSDLETKLQQVLQ